MNNTRRFLAELWGDSIGQIFEIEPTKEHPKTRALSFPVNDGIPSATDGYNTYINVAIAKVSNRRAKTDDIVSLTAFFADFDGKFYGSKEKAFSHITSLPLPPSVVIDSGGGFHCYWLLATPYIIDNRSRQRAQLLVKDWVKVVGGDSNAAHLIQLLRLPGTLNYKYNPPRPVTIVYADYERRYQVADFGRVINRVLYDVEPQVETQTQTQPPAQTITQTQRQKVVNAIKQTPGDVYLGLDHAVIDALFNRLAIPLDRLGDDTWYTLNCSLHDDEHASAAFHTQKLIYKCFACENEQADFVKPDNNLSPYHDRRFLTAYEIANKLGIRTPKRGDSSFGPQHAPIRSGLSTMTI